eukprot:g13294.t1
MALPPADGWRRAIVRVLDARKDGGREANKAALGHLVTFMYLPDDTKKVNLYRAAPEHDPEMMHNLQEFLCGHTGLEPDDREKAVMMNLLTALLLVELGRDKSGAYAQVRQDVIARMPPKVSH